MKTRLLAFALTLVLLPAVARAQDPATVARTGEPSTVQTNRTSEQPYRQPANMQTGVPGRAIHLDPADGPYLWVVDTKGEFLVAPEKATDRDRLLKHGDLSPAADGLTRGPARIAGLLTWDAKAKEWVMDADSSYNYKRSDGLRYLTADNLDAARELLARTGTDVASVRLDYKFLAKDGKAPLPAVGVLGAFVKGLLLVRRTWDGVFGAFESWLRPAPAETAKTDGVLERRAPSEGFTRILERASAEDRGAER